MASVFAVVRGGEGHKAILNEKLSGEWGRILSRSMVDEATRSN